MCKGLNLLLSFAGVKEYKTSISGYIIALVIVCTLFVLLAAGVVLFVLYRARAGQGFIVQRKRRSMNLPLIEQQSAMDKLDNDYMGGTGDGL